MKRMIGVFLCLLMVLLSTLCGCEQVGKGDAPPVVSSGGERTTEENSISPDYFTVLGLDWGITEQQAMETLDLSEADVMRNEAENGDASIGFTPDKEMFGVKPEGIGLFFSRESKDEPGRLGKVELLYHGKEREQTELLKEKISGEYGPLEDEVIIGTNGLEAELHADSSIDTPLEVSKFNNRSGADGYCWRTQKALSDMFSADQSKQFQKKVSEEHPYWENNEYWQMHMQNTPLAYMKLSEYDSYYGGRQYPDGVTVLVFWGYNVREWQEYTQASPEQ